MQSCKTTFKREGKKKEIKGKKKKAWSANHSKAAWVPETQKCSGSRVKFHGSFASMMDFGFFFNSAPWGGGKKGDFLGFLFPPLVLQSGRAASCPEPFGPGPL